MGRIYIFYSRCILFGKDAVNPQRGIDLPSDFRHGAKQQLVSLQRRCSNNLNQVAIHANTYGGIYPEEISALQRDYSALWGPLSDLLKQLSALVEL